MPPTVRGHVLGRRKVIIVKRAADSTCARTVRRVRFALGNDHESSVEVVVEQAGVRRSLPPGLELVVEWTWSGFADVTFGADWIALAVPPGGRIEVTEPVPADKELWLSVPVAGECEVGEFLVHNATDAPLRTFWEPYCGEGDIAPHGDPFRVKWFGNTKGVAICYEPGLVLFHDWGGSFQAWRPGGDEVFTQRTLAEDLIREGEPLRAPETPLTS